MAHDGALTVGLVGYGDAGRGIHARLAREAGHRVTHVVVRDPGRRSAAAQDWPGVVLHDDVASLVQAGDPPEVVVVASPTGLHTEHTQALLAAGLPTVVDKPLALDAEGAAHLVVRSQQTGTPLTVFQNRRWDAEQLTLAAVLEQGLLGAVHTFERRWERWRPVPRDRWKENAVGQGGGLLLDLGSHLVDSAVQLFGPVTGVHAELRSLTTPTEDDVFLSLRHRDGVVSRLWAGSLVGAPGPRTRVLGDAGAYLVTSFETEVTPYAPLSPPGDHEGLLVRGDEVTPVVRASGEHADFYRGVARWLRDGAAVPDDPGDAVRTAAGLDAARRSARTGCEQEPGAF